MTQNATPYTPPKPKAHRFHCPHCRTYASQGWGAPVRSIQYENHSQNHGSDENFKISMCSSCQKVAIWIGDKMVFPFATTAPPANADLPDDIKKDYEEAANILSLSPRGAAALLRLRPDLEIRG